MLFSLGGVKGNLSLLHMDIFLFLPGGLSKRTLFSGGNWIAGCLQLGFKRVPGVLWGFVGPCFGAKCDVLPYSEPQTTFGCLFFFGFCVCVFFFFFFFSRVGGSGFKRNTGSNKQRNHQSLGGRGRGWH